MWAHGHGGGKATGFISKRTCLRKLRGAFQHPCAVPAGEEGELCAAHQLRGGAEAPYRALSDQAAVITANKAVNSTWSGGRGVQ